MKKYMVTVKKITIAKMMVSAETGKKAIKKVDDLLKESIDNKVNLDIYLGVSPTLKYKVEIVKKNKGCQV